MSDPLAEYVKRIFHLAVRMRINEARMRWNLRRWDMNGPHPNLKAGRKFIDAARTHQRIVGEAARDGIEDPTSANLESGIAKLAARLEQQEREAK